MSDVKRWALDNDAARRGFATVVEWPTGAFVYYTDLAAVERENAELRAACAAANGRGDYWTQRAVELLARAQAAEARLEKLEAFYKAVAKLTLWHKTAEKGAYEEGTAVVYPSDLGPELEKISSTWWKEV